MDTSNRLIDLRGEGAGEDWIKEVEEMSQRTRMQSLWTQIVVWGQPERRGMGLVEVGMGG